VIHSNRPVPGTESLVHGDELDGAMRLRGLHYWQPPNPKTKTPKIFPLVRMLFSRN
jgi:hypothetical protein